MTRHETDLTADPNLQAWLQRSADQIAASTCPDCGSRALAQVKTTVKCCNCGKQWTVSDAHTTL